MSSGLARLAVVATVGGAFAGLFGVGGGIVMVPLLVLWLGYGEREATGTSLAAIAVVGALGAAYHATKGAVEVPYGLLMGLPGVVGVLAGVALQQRISERAVSGVFAVVLVLAAIGILL